MASFVLSFFPLDVLDEIWDLIESVSEEFLTFSLMFNIRLAGGHLYGKQLFTWLSLVVSLMASFCAVLTPN